VRISSDHYSILGVAPGVSASYLEQVYQSLLKWVPHRELSAAALASRQRVLQQSFQVLSKEELRLAYDHALEEGDRSIEIDDTDRIGALVILYGLGDYRQVLELAQPDPNEDELTRSDRILLRALAHQGIGLTHWQEGNFSAAGEALELAQEELMAAGLFLHLRGELQAYLFKLRPDRVLHLLSTAGEFPSRMSQGIALLKEMIKERGGIEGTGNDYSGLNTEQFLHFIQQARQYLPTHTQEQLFEEEAKRPSPVASYLYAYALVAIGFSEFRPDYIRRAKGIFIKLRPKQDVYLESSLCSLLLGQIEEAMSEIILSKEYGTILKLKPSPDAEPDLLWSLCQYCQRWLDREVYPHFADLLDRVPSLTAYFAEKQVETYLEELPHQSTTEWVPASMPRPTAPPPTRKIPLDTNPPPLVTPPPKPMTNPPVPPPSRTAKLWLILTLGLVGLFGGAGLWFLRKGDVLADFSLPQLPQPEEPVLIQRPLFASLQQAVLLRVPEEMDKAQAAQIISKWQNIKALAMGPKYETKALETILQEPSLSEWRNRSEQNKADQAHVEYRINGIEIKTVTPDGKDKAEVVAIISEDRDFIYRGEKVADFSRSGAKYEVTYKLVRQNDNWFIQDMIVNDE
jgi:hypothetical protein